MQGSMPGANISAALEKEENLAADETVRPVVDHLSSIQLTGH